MLAPLSPIALLGIPVAVVLLAYHWRSPWALVASALALWWAFAPVEGTAPDALWYAERGWALLVAGTFVLLDVRGGAGGTFSRAASATALGFAGMAVLAAVRRDTVRGLDRLVEARIRAGQAPLEEVFSSFGDSSAWDGVAQRVVDFEVAIYPALIALATICSVMAGWWFAGRLTGRRPELAAFRKFRFADHLVWVLVGGLVLFLLPLGDLLGRLGENLIVLMSGLYVARGAAVLVWLGAAVALSGWPLALVIVGTILLYPAALSAALVLGLSDTWLDLRERLTISPGDGPRMDDSEKEGSDG